MKYSRIVLPSLPWIRLRRSEPKSNLRRNTYTSLSLGFPVTAAVSRQYRPPSLMPSWVPMMISIEYRPKYHSHLATTRGKNTHTIRSTAVRCTTSMETLYRCWGFRLCNETSEISCAKHQGRSTRILITTNLRRLTMSAVQMGIEFGESLSLTELPPPGCMKLSIFNRRPSPLTQDPY